jgi:hypothetical protein
MGIAIASKTQYENAIKKLFPQGDYWEEQFADPESDASFLIKTKADELIRFRGRMSNLYDESRTETTEESIEDWERVVLDELNIGKTLVERRLLLKKVNVYLNRAELQKIAVMFGLNIQEVTIPYRPRFFGFAKFGQERLGSFTSFSVLRIVVIGALLDDYLTREFEKAIRDILLANQIPFYYYGVFPLIVESGQYLVTENEDYLCGSILITGGIRLWEM